MKSSPQRLLSLSLQITCALSLSISALASDENPVRRRFDIVLSAQDLANSAKNVKMEKAVGIVTLTNADGRGKLVAKAAVGTRGQTSISAPRKNFSIELDNCGKSKKKARSFAGYEIAGKNLCKFTLTSMWQDRGYVSTKIGLDFMRTFQVSAVLTEYVELFLNGKSRGLYLMTEDPKHKVKKEIKANWIAKRKGSVDLEKLKQGKYDGIGQLETVFNNPEAPCSNCEDQYKVIRQLLRNTVIGKSSGETVEAVLRKVIDVDQMMTFMAINRWLRNGDYADEFLMYQTQPNTPFKIFGWDYDDLFKPVHFLSRTPLRLALNDDLNYSSEASIFILFAANSHLKKLYHKHLFDLLTAATEEKVDEIMVPIAKGLAPYAGLRSVTEMSKLDDPKITENQPYTLEYLTKNWAARRTEILSERAVILKKLAEEGYR